MRIEQIIDDEGASYAAIFSSYDGDGWTEKNVDW
jgi:hypothetical protein